MVLFGSTYTIKRTPAEGYYNNSGLYIEGSPEANTSIIADIQSLTSKELESLNIGRDDLGKIKIFSDTELLVALAGEDGNYLQNGDKVTFLNDDYEIIQRVPFVNNIIPHFEYIAELR